MRLSHELSEFDFNEAGNIAIINGQPRLHETESILFKKLAAANFQPIVIDDLFNFPKRIAVLKLMDVETIVLGTTGTYGDKLNKVLEAFEKMEYLPKNAIFTMGEGRFHKYEKLINFYKIMPLQWGDDEVIIQRIED